MTDLQEKVARALRKRAEELDPVFVTIYDDEFLELAKTAESAIADYIEAEVPPEPSIVPEQEHLRQTFDFGNYASGYWQCRVAILKLLRGEG